MRQRRVVPRRRVVNALRLFTLRTHPLFKAPRAIPFGWQEYAELVDWTGRQVRPGKRGHIGDAQPALLHWLGLQGEAFADMACHLLERFGVAVGAPPAMAQLCARTQRRFLHGQRVARRMLLR